MQADIDSGRPKSFYKELLDEMKVELAEKDRAYTEATSEYQPIDFDTADTQVIQSELRRLIETMDAEVQNPEMLNRIVSKYVPKILIQRETKTVHITFHIKQENIVLYQKAQL